MEKKRAPKKPSVSTIKLSKQTKSRLLNLRVYKRETYEDVMQRLLEILNLTRLNPEIARSKLVHLDRQRKLNLKELRK